jgi:WD40 repeat protein
LRLNNAFLFLAGAAVILLPATSLQAQGTKLWSQSHYEEFEKGTPKGVAISSEGYLESGPLLKTLAATGSTYVWSVAAGRQGDAFVGTGSPASVLQVDAAGKQTKLFESKDMSVQVVRVGPDGSVYAATLPSGKVYRLHPGQPVVDESKAEVVFDPQKTDEKPKYIWDMAFDEQGRLYLATGAPAVVYRVNPSSASAKPEKFFSSDEQHLRCLLFEKDGSLLAGSDSGGLVYRIDKDGKGLVIYDAPKAEITALAESPDGMLYVAAVGEKSKNNLPPLPVQGNVSMTATITIIQPGSIQASNTNGLIPEGSEVYEINQEGAPRKLWAAHDDVIYAIASTPKGLIAATGNRGHIYRVQEDGSFTDIGHAEASQVVAFASTPKGMYLGASNGGKVLWLADDATAEHSFESMVFDAGFFSRFGHPDVDAPHNSRYELYVRTGNVENPVRGWGEWQKVVASGGEPAMASARFVQWKAVLHEGKVEAVGIHYLPVNVAPVVDEIVVAPGTRANTQTFQQTGPQQTSITFPSQQNANNFINLNQEGANGPLAAVKDRTAVTARWAAHDDNGDDLSFRVYFKAEDEQNWLLLRDRTRDRFYSFDAVRIPDGVYRLKVVASDAPSHTPGEAKLGDRISDRFTVDTTPPVISGMTAQMAAGKIHVALTAKDELSTIDRAEYSIDAGRWLYLEPTGKLSDSKEEHYDFAAALPEIPSADEDTEASSETADSSKNAKATEHVITVRVYDRYGNVTAEKALVR